MQDGIPGVKEIHFRPIGVIRTPYGDDWAPDQPVERASEKDLFRLVLFDSLAEGLRDLDRFAYIYVLYFMNRSRGPATLRVQPPWAKGKEVGLFASRSPARPNPIGLSIVRLIRVQGNEVVTSPLDAFDESPLLDVKPYIKDLDAKADANVGWIEDLEDREHLLLHIRGIAHGR
jgi:tRNA-Thr(GGU) m(6)t(6)A37 methyltransferase TsaA